MSKKYNAFISYPQDSDKNIAEAIQKGLRKLGAKKHLLQFRALQIFRDETDFSGHEDLKSKIEKGLDDSEYLVVLASPKIAYPSTSEKRNWIEEEIKYWIKTKYAEEWESGKSIESLKIIICITDGEISWDTENKDFDWGKTNCLPPILKSRFADLPFWVDFREIKEKENNSQDVLSLDFPDFKQKVAEISSQIQNVTVDQLISEDIKRLRIWKLTIASMCVLVLMSILAVFWQQNKALQNYQTAYANSLATQAISLSDKNPTHALRIAIMAYDKSINSISQAEKSLAYAFYNPLSHNQYFYSKKIEFGNVIRKIDFLGTSNNFLCFNDSEFLKIFNIDGSLVKTMNLNARIDRVASSKNGKDIVATTIDGEFYYIKYSNLKFIKKKFSIGYSGDLIKFSHDNKLVAWNSGHQLFMYNIESNSIDSLTIDQKLKNFFFIDNDQSIATISGWLDSTKFEIGIYDLELNRIKYVKPNTEIQNVDVSYDGQLLAYTDWDEITILSLPNLSILRQYENTSRNTNIKFLPKNELVVHDGNVVQFDTLGNIKLTEDVDGTTYFLNVDTQGSVLYYSDSDSRLYLKSMDGVTVGVINEQDIIFSADISNNEKHLVTGNDAGELYIYDLQQYNSPSLIHDTLNYQAINDVLYDKINDQIITISIDGYIKVWDSDYKLVKQMKIDDELKKGIIYKKELIVGGGESIYFIDYNSFNIIKNKTIKISGEVTCAVLSLSQKYWAMANINGELVGNFWSTDSTIILSEGEVVRDIDFDNDESKVFVCADNSILYEIDLMNSSNSIKEHQFDAPIKKMLIENGYFLVQTEESIWMNKSGIPTTDKNQLVSTSSNSSIRDVVFMDEEQILYCTDNDICYKISANGNEISSKPNVKYPYKLISSKDKKYTAVLTLNGNVFLLNQNLETIYEFSFPEKLNTANSGFFTNDNHHLIVSSWAGLAKVWKTPIGIRAYISKNDNSIYKLTAYEKNNYGLLK